MAARGRTPGRTPRRRLLGSGDFQSLADLGNSYAVVEQNRVAPFTKGTALTLVMTTLLPVVPLLLTMFSLLAILF